MQTSRRLEDISEQVKNKGIRPVHTLPKNAKRDIMQTFSLTIPRKIRKFASK